LGVPVPATLPAVMWGEPLPPPTLENVGDRERPVISTELKDGVRLGNV